VDKADTILEHGKKSHRAKGKTVKKIAGTSRKGEEVQGLDLVNRNHEGNLPPRTQREHSGRKGEWNQEVGERKRKRFCGRYVGVAASK